MAHLVDGFPEHPVLFIRPLQSADAAQVLDACDDGGGRGDRLLLVLLVGDG